ncbi:MAG: 30S ribosomal protein S21 [Mycoplasmoidaceae bacterium]
MPKIEVRNGDVEQALRNFKRITSETRKNSKRHEFYLRPGLRKKEKEKAAEKKLKKLARKMR